ncbi:MAG: NAD-dependent epimerase/dehydratase family protein [Candidatus Pacebacteria bacterium]|nr:NAD-dependent epimerase/dehydratase family protein [Candidatus Paceibacterota bacterium]
MKYIVTGGAGFIGSNLVDRLIENGHEVTVIDNLSTGRKENINPRANFLQLDITDEKSIEPFFKGIDGIFHLAAMARIQPSFENPDLYFRVNVLGTRNILEAAKKNGVKRVVYSASSSAYGDSDVLPLRENFKVPAQALNPYASTKRIGEMLMVDLGKLTGGPETVCLRYFNVFGPRQSTLADGPYALVVGIFLGLKNQGKPMTIVPDGHQRRAFTWVNDVAEANMAAMNSQKVGNGEIINIGSGVSYSIWDIAKLVLESPNATPEQLISSGKCVLAPKRQGEVKETVADISKAKDLLGWEPKMNFPDGIKKLLEADKK